MSPRIVTSKRCPHCRVALPTPTPRVCPQCAGSLQKRFLSLGCLTSAPPAIVALVGLVGLAVRPSDRAEAESPPARKPALDADVRAAAPQVTHGPDRR